MPKRTPDSELAAALTRLKAWIWLASLRFTSDLSLRELHELIEVPAEDRGPLFDVLRDGANPDRIRVGRRTLRQAFAGFAFAAPADAAFCHPVWRSLDPSPLAWEEEAVQVSQCLRRSQLELFSIRELGQIEDLGMYVAAPDPEMPVATWVDHNARLLQRGSDLDALLIALHTSSALFQQSWIHWNPASEAWRVTLDRIVKTLQESLPDEGAVWLGLAVENAHLHARRLAAPSRERVDGMRRSVALKLLNIEDESHALSGRALKREARLAYALALKRQTLGGRPCRHMLLASDPWISYFREHQEVLSDRLDAATYQMYGDDEPTTGAALPLLPLWEGRRLEGLEPKFIHMTHDSFLDTPFVNIRREIAGMQPLEPTRNHPSACIA